MRIRIAALLAALLALGGVAFIGSPVQAASRFSWGADVKYRIDSRDWENASKGTVEIQSACKATNKEKYTITLYSFWGTSYHSNTYTCTDKIQSFTWTGIPKGNYHFRLSRAAGKTAAVHFSGNVFHP